jgi:hypothetical protein
MLHRVALVRTTRYNIPEDAILHSHHRENLKSYIYAFFLMDGDYALSLPTSLARYTPYSTFLTNFFFYL